VSQPPDDGVPHTPPPAAAAPPVARVSVDDLAGQDRPVRLKTLPGHHQPQAIQAAERRQIRAGEGSVEHVGFSWKVV